MLKILQRYLAANFIFPFALSTMFFVCFLLTFQLFRIIRLIIAKGVPFLTVLELIGHIAISFLPMAVPLSALFAMIYAMNKLSEDSEIVAMRSFGLKKFDLFLPFMLLGVLLSASIFSLNRNLIPYSKRIFKNTVIKLSSKGMLGNIKPEQFFVDIPGVTLFAEKVAEGGKKLEDVFIHIKGDGDAVEQVISAKKGALIKQKGVGGTIPSLRLHLIQGNIVKSSKSKNELEKYIFEEYDFPIISQSYRPGFVTKDSMRTSAELKDHLKESRKKYETLKSIKIARDLSGSERSQLGHLTKIIPKSEIEYWSRFNTPLQTMIFILLGFALGIKKGRGRTRNTGALGLGILIAYYVLFFGGVSLARKHVLPANVVVFFPSIVALIFGVRFYRKLDWLS